MMLGNQQSLENSIVRLLSELPGLAASEIHQTLASKGEKYSLRGIYKELSKLEQQEIISKVQKRYHLRLDWVINMLDFCDRAYDSYTDSDYLKNSLIKSSSKTKYSFNSLRKLDLCWIQLMISLHKVYPNQPMFVYCPYQWFHLVHGFAVKQFFTAVNLSAHKRYHIIGNDSYLERLGLKDLPKTSEVSFAQSPFHDQRQNYYTIIGSHVISVRLGKDITKRIDELFNSVNSASDMNSKKISKILNARVKPSLIIEENPQKADKLVKKFREFFGITDE